MNKSNHILVLLDSLDINDSSGTKGRVALLQNMVAAGFEVTALHYTQKDITIEGIKTIGVTETKSAFYFLSRLQRYFYKWFKINIGNIYEKRNGFSFNWRGAEIAFVKALKKYNPQDFGMIWTLGKGTLFRAHAGVLRCPEWHSKWYAYVHDPYPQQLYPRPYNFVPIGYKQKRNFFAAVTKKAYRMVFPSLLLKEWMQSYFSTIEEKALIIPHQISEVTVEEKQVPSYFKENYFTILHAGNLLNLRDPDVLIRAYNAFLAKCPEARKHSQLLFLGKSGSFKKELQQAQKDIPQLYASDGYVPFELVYQMQQKACVNVILEAKSEISPFLPGKFAHCVAANKPIVLIGPYYSETKRLLGKEYTLSFEFDELDRIAHELSRLYGLWKKNKNELKLERPYLREYLSFENLKRILSSQD